MYDYHVHSHFSTDCKVQMEEMILSGIKKELKEICFTDHVDYDYGDKNWIFNVDYQEWDKTFYHLKEKYSQQITLKKGIELGIQPHIFDKCQQLINCNDFDFILMSMHTCEKKDLYNNDFFIGKTVEEAWRVYIKEMAYCAEHFDDFNVIGHVNLLKRYHKGAATFDEHHLEEDYKALFRILVSKQKGLEVNTTGYTYPTINDAQPSKLLLKWYREVGGTILTLGSDSHTTDRLGLAFKKVLINLNALGFEHFYSFEKRRAIPHDIKAFI